MSEKINGRISTFTSSLCIEIEKHLSDFFITESFGCRTTKGFGSFTLIEVNSREKSSTKADIVSCLRQDENVLAVYSCKFDNDIPFQRILKLIKSDSQILRSGINNPGKSYVKSILFIYFCRHFSKKWDKRWIKKEMGDYYKEVTKTHDPIDCNCNNTIEERPDTEYLFERALLGLPETNEYKLAGNNRKFIVEIDSSDNSVDRFKAPIIYKLIDKTVYLIVSDNFKQILSKTFSFKLFRKEGNTKIFLKSFSPLSTPDASFNPVLFLDWAFSYIKGIDEETVFLEEECTDDLRNYYFHYEKIFDRNA